MAGRLSTDNPTPDLRMIVPALSAWAGAMIGVLNSENTALVVVIIFVSLISAVISGVLKQWLVVGSSATLIVCLTSGYLQSIQFNQGPLGTHFGQNVTITFELTSDVSRYDDKPNRPAFAAASAKLILVEGYDFEIVQSIPIQVTAQSELAVELSKIDFGSTVVARAKLEAPKSARPVAASAKLVGTPEITKPPSRPMQVINRYRDSLSAAMIWAPVASRGLVPSLVVGESSKLDSQLKEDFKITGLSHLTAVSGTNLTLLLGFLLAVSKTVGVRGWWLRLVQVVGVGLFVILCRGESSVLRAAAMGVVGLAALGQTVDQRRGLRHLSVAVWGLLLWDPWLSITWGFALSVAASAGILWWGANWQRKADGKWPNWLVDAITIPLAAQIATGPLIVALSSQISVVGLIANVLAGPFVGPATVLGLVAGLISVVWPFGGQVFGWLAGVSVQPIIWISQIGAGLPGARIELPAGPISIGLTVAGSIILAKLVPQLIDRKWLALLTGFLLVIGCIWRPILVINQDWDIVFCDVGQGDMILLRVSENEAVVVDVGPDGKSAASCLKTFGVEKIPVLVLSHLHSDHVGGFERVLEDWPVGQVMISPLHSPQAAYEQVYRQTTENQIPICDTYPGHSWKVGAVEWKTISTGPNIFLEELAAGSEAESTVENDSSVIAIAESSGLSVLLTGDSEPAGQRHARYQGIPLEVDILKVPHHGSSRQDPKLFADSKAKLAVVSVGEDNDYGHPSKKTLSLIAENQMRLKRTDQDNHVLVRAEDFP